LRTLGAEQAAIRGGFSTTTITLWGGTGKRVGESVVSRALPDGTTGRTIKRADLSSTPRFVIRRWAEAFASSTASDWSPRRKSMEVWSLASRMAPSPVETC
jgi:hypothetical protein